MRFEITKAVFKTFPKFRAGVLVFSGVENAPSSKEILNLLKEIEHLIRLNFIPEKLVKHPLITPWKVAYEKLGVKPRHAKSSVETMIEYILKGRGIKPVNKFVDLCNYLSLKYMIPFAAHDLDSVDGEIVLTRAHGGEQFRALGSKKAVQVERNEIVYRDRKDIIARRWNWQHGKKTKITKETKNAIVIAHGLPPLTDERLKAALKETRELVTTFCKGKAKQFVLSAAKRKIYFSF